MAARKSTKPAAKATEAVAAEAIETQAEEIKTEEIAEPKTAETKKAPVKKAKSTAAAKTVEKKPAAKKSAEKCVLHIQYGGKAYSQEDLLKIAKDVWKYDLKRKVGELKNIELYVKPEENKVYYVMNSDFTGSFDI